MKGFTSLPSKKEQLRLYNIMQSKLKPVPEEQFIQAAQISRFDPRLGEITVQRLFSDWQNLNPMKLAQLNLQSIWPQCLAVLLGHVKLLLKEENREEAKLFEHFMKLSTAQVKPLPYQSFSIGLYSPGGKLQKEKSLFPHPVFSRWGFYETDLFIRFSPEHQSTTLDAHTRKNILKNLLQKQKQIKVEDYIRACRGAIHRRQAERDLNDFFKLKKTGNTRGRYYSL